MRLPKKTVARAVVGAALAVGAVLAVGGAASAATASAHYASTPSSSNAVQAGPMDQPIPVGTPTPGHGHAVL